MTKSLVTGGNGYFGQLLVGHLLARGDDVRVLDIDIAGVPDGVEAIGGDIRDPDVVERAVHGVDVVFHNVAQVPLVKDETLLRTVNVDGTRNLLDASRRAGVAKVVHTSSSAVFGIPASNPVMPDTVPRPMEAYGHAKLAAEWVCLLAVSNGLDVSIVRPRTILGHGRLGIFAILFDWVRRGDDPIVLGDGSNRYQFVHADDLATACLAAGDRPGAGVYNVGTDRFGTMYEALAHLCDHAGTGSSVRSLPAVAAVAAMRLTAAAHVAPFAPYHWLMYSRDMWFDIDHAVSALHWSPRFSTDEMFAHSYDWFCAREVGGRAHNVATSPHRRAARQGILAIARHASRFLPTAMGRS